MNNLALQVGVVHDIEIDETESAYAGGGEIERHRRAQASGADAEHARGFQLLLTLHAHLGHDEMAGVAQDFVFVQGYRNFGDGGHMVLG